MRIISQSGNFDFPYERALIGIDKNGLIANPCGITALLDFRKIKVVAKYSSVEKAIKAMQMLREAYSPHIDLRLSDKQKADLKKLGAVKLGTMQNANVEYMNFENYYFQFPKDEEIEV